MALNNKSSFPAFEIFNTVLALLSWILPDIPVASKIIITVVLLATILLVRGMRHVGRFDLNTIEMLFTYKYILLLVAPLTISILESLGSFLIVLIISSIVSNNLEFLRGGDGGFAESVLLFLEVGFTYGACVGLPVCIMGSIWCEDEDKSERAASIGCFLQTLLLVGGILLIGISEKMSSTFSPILAASGLGGPLLPLLLVAVGPFVDHSDITELIGGLVLLTILWLQNYQYEKIGCSVAKRLKHL